MTIKDILSQSSKDKMSSLFPEANKVSVAHSHAEEDGLFPRETLKRSKYIYGTYIEMAFHNFFLNMQHIYRLVTGLDIIEEARKKYENSNQKPWNEDFADEKLVWRPMFYDFTHCRSEERLRVEELLNRHFPFLEAARDYIKDKDEYKHLSSIKILRRLSKSMRILRNEYSHYKIKLHPGQINDYERQEELVAGILRHAFLGGKRIVKTRFAFSDNAMKCAEQYKFSSVRDSAGRFTKNKEEKRGFKYRITQSSSDHLTAFGLVFLSSLFLEKKYSKIFADKTHCIPAKDSAVMCELISVFRIRLHAEKIYVDKNTDALALDILTELRRCPKELFELLKPEYQNKFRIKATGEEDVDVLLMRHRDRFAYLVMKYIDDTKMFNNIRFQVSLGRYFFEFYDKHCIDSETRVRSLSKKVQGFGRLSEIDAARTSLWDGKIREYDDVHKNTSTENPYITDHHPQYVVNGNRIAMRIFDDDIHFHVPELTAEGVRNITPSCWLSTYELPAMAFLIHLRGGEYVEELIKATVANYKRLFADIADGTLLPVENQQELEDVLSEKYCGIKLCDIPDDMADYLLSRSVDANAKFKKHANDLIETLIEQTEYKKKKYKEQRKTAGNVKMNKFGKKNYVAIRPGELASFLAKDIMFFQPNNSENSRKLTSLNFRIMQSMLAQYDGDAEALKRMFVSAHVIGNKEGFMDNPVVMRLWKNKKTPKNTADIYEKYLEARLTYLKECKSKDAKSLYFLYANRMKWQEHDEEFYQAKAARYLNEESNGVTYEKAIELPRGLFEDAIREELMQIPEIQADAQDGKKNIAYLIYGYMKKVMHDDSQPYYEAERTYPLLNKLYSAPPSTAKCYRTAQQLRLMLMRKSSDSIRKEMQKYLDPLLPDDRKAEEERLSRLLNNMKDNETLLKRYKVQDVILFLIAKDVFLAESSEGRFDAISRIRLADIQDGNVLEQPIDFSVKIISKNNYEKTVWQNGLKLKDYAKFYSFLGDRRLPSLLDLVRQNTVDRLLIDEEFMGYDKVHPQILEDVFAYEEGFSSDSALPGHSFSDFVYADDSYSYEEKKQITGIRNSFAHCSYPMYKNMDEKSRNQVMPKKAITISQTFKEKIKKDG